MDILRIMQVEYTSRTEPSFQMAELLTRCLDYNV